MKHEIILDNEAIQALADVRHPKHRRIVAIVQVVADRRKKRVTQSIVVPTSVRVESGWVRSEPVMAFVNGLRISDASLDRTLADAAAAIRRDIGTHISVTDAHIGAVVGSSTADRVSVVSSDPDDMRAVAGTKRINVVTI